MNFAEPRLIWLALAAPLAALAAYWLHRRRAAAEAAWASRAIEPRLRSGSRPRPPLLAAILLANAIDAAPKGKKPAAAARRARPA